MILLTQNSKFHSLRFLLPALLSLLAIGGGMLLYVMDVQIHEARFEADFNRDQTLQVTRIQADVERWVQRNDMDMVQSILAELGVNPDLQTSLFLDVSNTILASTRREYIGRPLAIEYLGLHGLNPEELTAAIQTTRRTMRATSLFTSDRNGLVECFPTSLPMSPGELEVRHGGVILVGYDLHLEKSDNLHHLQTEFLTYFVIILIVALALGISLHFLITRRLERLKTAMTDFSVGKAVAEFPLGPGDEISDLVKRFKEMATIIGKEMDERVQTEEVLRRLNRELRAISNCNQILMHTEDEQTLLNEVCKIISNEAGYRLVWVGYAENDDTKTIHPVAWSGFDSGYIANARLSWADTERGRGPGGEAIRSGKTIYIQDFATDPQMAPWRESALQRDYHSAIALPLKDENENVFGVLIIYSTEINAFISDELRLLEELSGDLAFGIMVLRARSDRKRAEEELRLMNERFSLATNAARLGVWDWNLQKNELVWDDRMYTLYGIKREDFAGAYEAWLKGVHPDDRNTSDEISRQARLGEREYDTEFRVIWPDGSIHYLKAYGQIVKDANGALLRMTGINFDITENKLAAEEIRKLNLELEQRVTERTAQLQASNNELEAFAYSVSHDLRAPLRSIDGFSQVLLEEYQDKVDEQGKDYLQRVRSASQRMGQLIDDMLNLSRVTRSEINIQPVNLSEIFQEIADGFLGIQPERQVEFIIQKGIKAKGDSRLLRIVLENLIGNAWKFTSNHPTARIEFGMRDLNNTPVYFVQDDGAGFNMKYAQKLFGAFQRLHKATEFPGTGIGLATVQRVIHRHGGKVWAEGEVEKGAVFYFSIA